MDGKVPLFSMLGWVDLLPEHFEEAIRAAPFAIQLLLLVKSVWFVQYSASSTARVHRTGVHGK
jgi:hypothetical protein